jgi:hypothetical protein
VTPVAVVVFPVVLGLVQDGVARSKRRRRELAATPGSVGGIASNPLLELERQVHAAMQVGAEPESPLPESAFAPVFKGWNVWSVWQVKDLPFSILMLGVERSRQLRIWVEDHVRLGAPGTEVADALDLKGGQIEILPALPAGLKSVKRRESIPGPAIVVESQDEPPELRVVRFFNRGSAGKLVWPHDDAYMLDEVFDPDPKNEATSGPGPGTIASRTTAPIAEGGIDVVKFAAVAAGVVLVLALALRYAASRRLAA